MAIITFKEGSKGAVVKQIQKVVGCYPDGIWGKNTTECLKAWQKAHSLTPDGIAGPRTLAAMGIQAVTPAAAPSTPIKAVYAGCPITLRRSKRRIDEIIIHCTATPEGSPRTVEQIRAQHKAQGWSDIGYQYVVYLDGTVHEGRNVDIAGAHCVNHNAHSIGIVYVGGLENRPDVPYNKLRAKDTRTPAQKASLLGLLMDLRQLYPQAEIKGHRDCSPDKNHNGTVEQSEWIKECPSFDAKAEYRRV